LELTTWRTLGVSEYTFVGGEIQIGIVLKENGRLSRSLL
jgi:hypothetical protein